MPRSAFAPSSFPCCCRRSISSGAYSTNPEHVPGGAPAPYAVAAPELKVQSDWERHSLSADFAGSYTQYFSDLVPSLNVPYMNSKIDGRVDVTRDTQLILQLRGIINTDNPGSPNNTANLAKAAAQFRRRRDRRHQPEIQPPDDDLQRHLRSRHLRQLRADATAPSRATATATSTNMRRHRPLLLRARSRAQAVRGIRRRSSDLHDEQFDQQRACSATSLGVTGWKFGTAVNLFGSLTGEMNDRRRGPRLPRSDAAESRRRHRRRRRCSGSRPR